MQRLLPFAAAALAAAAAPALAHAAPPVARPNPALSNLRLDYVAPLSALGAVEVRGRALTAAAVADAGHLRFRDNDDLGGFAFAPRGGAVLSGGGWPVVWTRPVTAAPPDNGRQPLPGLGVPPPVRTPHNQNRVPPPNQGFGGRPRPQRPGPPGTTTTAPSLPPTTTTPTTTTPPPTTTTPTTTTPRPPTTPTGTTTASPETPPSPTQPGAGPQPGPGSACGSTDLEIESEGATCTIDAVNMAPGDSASEVLTLTNPAATPVTLSLRAGGVQNRLWQDMRLAVWEQGTPAPAPLPPLLAWTAQFNAVTVLPAGGSVRLVVALALADTAGNEDQGLAASIVFTWRTQA